MIDVLQRTLEADSRTAYALVFGSQARGKAHPHSDVDVAIGFADGRRLGTLELGELVARLESAVSRSVHLVVLDEAPPGLAYRVFRDGRPIVRRDEPTLKARLARAVLEYLDFQPVEAMFADGVLRATHQVLLASKIAAVRDAVARIRSVLPADREAFVADRTAREITVLNLFVAFQEGLSLATHWLADQGLDVPETYADVFRRLGERGAIPAELAGRMAAASGFRNLIAHQYGALDLARVHAIASERLDDLLGFCDELARSAG